MGSVLGIKIVKLIDKIRYYDTVGKYLNTYVYLEYSLNVKFLKISTKDKKDSFFILNA